MPIKGYSEMQNTLKNYGMRNWSSTAELSNRIDLKAPFNPEQGDAKDVKSFGEFLTDSISKVNGLQQDANVAMQKLASGESKNLHETLLAVEKAEIAFKTMNQVRMKVIDAYKEIMRMQV
jgi:flagellar hook-basal body complex protein FliE